MSHSVSRMSIAFLAPPMPSVFSDPKAVNSQRTSRSKVVDDQFTRKPRPPRPSYSEEQKFYIMYARVLRDLPWPEIEDDFAHIFGSRSKGGLTSVYCKSTAGSCAGGKVMLNSLCVHQIAFAGVGAWRKCRKGAQSPPMRTAWSCNPRSPTFRATSSYGLGICGDSRPELCREFGPVPFVTPQTLTMPRI